MNRYRWSGGLLARRISNNGQRAESPPLHGFSRDGRRPKRPPLHWFFVAIAVVVIATGCRNDETPRTGTAHAHAAQAAHIYHCPMHPTVTSDKPAACPICGMALVKRPTDTAATTSGAISLTPDQRVTGNVRTVRATVAAQASDVVATGRVTVDERRVSQVTTFAGGRIERLFANFTGDTIRRGETVASIYSPELYATQRELLLALQNRDRMSGSGFESARDASDDLAASARRRLLLSGMSEGQVATLERTRKPLYAVAVVSPVSGVVTRKLVVEQQYVGPGQPLLELADLSTVWIEADVYEQQLPNVRIGERATIEAAAVPGRAFEGRVSFIVPMISGTTRTARVRIELPNPALALKPDMFVNVRIAGAPAAPQVVVPATAVIDRGQSRFVWIESAPGRYEPRQVQTGARSGDNIAIVSGINEGEVVVVEGAFLLDSEAQLRAH